MNRWSMSEMVLLTSVKRYFIAFQSSKWTSLEWLVHFEEWVQNRRRKLACKMSNKCLIVTTDTGQKLIHQINYDFTFARYYKSVVS